MVQKLKKLSLVLAAFVVLGAAVPAPVGAQQGFVLIQSDDVSDFYIDTNRMQYFSKSKFRDVWIKKVFVDNGKEKSNVLEKGKVTKKKSDRKAKTKENKNFAFMLFHEQFDPNGFRYQILEVSSFDDAGRMVSNNTEQSPWREISPGSIEEKVLAATDTFIDGRIDQVIVR
ncbi:MAG: hypothetical protein H6Q75_498 [Firmicutes bacterium]|nr:hypothetical protein [Bacillota bacterium]